MTVTINGSTGLTFPDNATQSTSPKTGFVNRIINGGFGINQRGVSGTVTLTAGVYGHDRWKAGASGCTYTFATVANVTTLTITAGSLIQVIEGINLQSGTFTLSFTGTAQGKIGAGSFGASGITGAAVGGTNLNIEINTGTVSLVQFELGSTATPFEFRSIGTELALCQRYCYVTNGSVSVTGPVQITNSQTAQRFVFPVPLRVSPTASINTAGSYVVSDDRITDYTATTFGIASAATNTLSGRVDIIGFTSLPALGILVCGIPNAGTGRISFSAEL